MNRVAGMPVTTVERVGLLAALALSLCLMWPLRAYVTDDTFIHLRYAQHLSRGEGLVFNAGERVYGCTSPLWAALLADGLSIGLDGVWTARLLGVLATLASIGFFFQLMRRTLATPELRAIATVAWGGHAWMARWAMSGMETPLAVALVLAGFVAFTEGPQWGSRPVRTGALWAVGALARPEVAFLLGLWGIFLIADTENRAGIRRLVFGSLPPLLIYGGWLAFARVYFGSFLPQTLSAKVAGSAPGFTVDNLRRIFEIIGATEASFLVVIVLALVFAGRRLFPGRLLAQRLLPWAWVLAMPALYVSRGVPVISRYLLPLMPVIAWLAWRAVEVWWVGSPPAPARRGRAIVFAAILALAVLGQNFMVYRGRVLPHVREFTAGLETSLVRWGKWFRVNTPVGSTIATPDIGAIGYFSNRRVLDLAGLVTPGMVPLLERVTPEAIVEEFSFAAVGRPEFLVDRAPRGHELWRRSRFGDCLVRLGDAEVGGLGIANPNPVVYTFYRIDWSCADTLLSTSAVR